MAAVHIRQGIDGLYVGAHQVVPIHKHQYLHADVDDVSHYGETGLYGGGTSPGLTRGCSTGTRIALSHTPKLREAGRATASGFSRCSAAKSCRLAA